MKTVIIELEDTCGITVGRDEPDKTPVKISDLLYIIRKNDRNSWGTGSPQQHFDVILTPKISQNTKIHVSYIIKIACNWCREREIAFYVNKPREEFFDIAQCDYQLYLQDELLDIVREVGSDDFWKCIDVCETTVFISSVNIDCNCPIIGCSCLN